MADYRRVYDSHHQRLSKEGADRRTDGRTDPRPLHRRSCCAFYSGSASKDRLMSEFYCRRTCPVQRVTENISWAYQFYAAFLNMRGPHKHQICGSNMRKYQMKSESTTTLIMVDKPQPSYNLIDYVFNTHRILNKTEQQTVAAT